MIRQSVVGVAVVAAAVALSGCSRTEAPPGPAGPTLSLVGAKGVAADLRRTVTQVDGFGETTLSVLDTTVWAPFNEKGAAVPDTAAGIPGPIGWLQYDDGSAGDESWTRYGSFVDSTGVLHELRLTVKGRSLLSRMEYRRNGVPAVDYHGDWLNVTGGWVLDAEAVTYYPAGGPAVRVDIAARGMTVTQATPGMEAVRRAGFALADLMRPEPLAAQMYFGACNSEWLQWGGAALLAEFFWVKFLKSTSYADFKRAMAATMAAGVTLNALADCMSSQPEQPDPN